ncbi:MAG TPA: formate dehydrogenase subunit gamma [Sulfurospirillum arcachonense]|nr:formate dehydrogenase subunit gamma [Sulfurospirillum arcachonense]
MKKYLFLFVASLLLASAAFAADSQIWDAMRVQNILGYGQEESLKLGQLFTMLQSSYFAQIFLAILIGVPVVFLLHFLIIGPKVFSHEGKKIFAFSVFKRIIHLIAAIAFIILIPTGLMIIFGNYLGGGTLIEYARHFHGIATVMFTISVIPMLLFWFIEMIPTMDDVKWMFILGGYLSKEIKEIPAGKFNAGQKMWFWIATLGGFVMIATGAIMYLQDFDFGIAKSLGLSQIDLLRASAIVHNVFAFAIIAFFFTHVYMAAIAIKGAIYSMITGYKEHDEVKYLHSTWYKKLKKEGKI